MSNIPENLRYTKTHEWVRVEQDGTLVLGITDHAQDQLGDMVFIETGKSGKSLAAAGECAVVESVKTAADVYLPVAGEIVETNQQLSESPEIVNKDPYGKGWLVKFKPANVSDINSLMDAKAYTQFLATSAH